MESIIQLAFSEVYKFLAIHWALKTNQVFNSPTIASLFLTSKCNSRCSMCDFWKKEKDMGRELNTREWFKIIESLKTLGVKILSFSAKGEIFTRKDAIDIIKKAKEMGFSYSINSNGLAIDKQYAKAIKELNPYSVIIGIDTVNDEEYHTIRGIKDGVDRVRNNIKLLLEQNYHNVAIGTVILKENVEHLLELTKEVKNWGIKSIRFTAFQPFGFDKDVDSETWELYQDSRFLDALERQIQKLIEFKKQYGFISNSISYMKMIPDFYRNRHFSPLKCITGCYAIKIDPFGVVNLCPLMDNNSVIGNALEKSLKELWYSNEAQIVRKKIMEGKCPACWLSCYAEENLRFSFRYGWDTNWNKIKRGFQLLR